MFKIWTNVPAKRPQKWDQNQCDLIVLEGLKMAKHHFDYCVTTTTAHGYPYIDLVRPTLGVAIGGCGQAAKSSDEIGKMAAQ